MIKTPRTIISTCGTSLVEVLVASSMLSVLMAATYGSVISQMRTHATQSMVSETLQSARSALAVLADQVDTVGLGVPHAKKPSVAPTLITAEPKRISFWANFPPQHTYLTATTAKASTQLAVQSTVGLHVDSTVYIANSDSWHFATVVKVGPDTITIDTPLAFGFAAGSPVMAVEQITFELKGQALVRNGRPLIQHVRDLTFTYDAVALTAVRTIAVRLTVETRSIDPRTGAPLPVTVQTALTPSNLAL